jgi:hypothetical protein
LNLNGEIRTSQEKDKLKQFMSTKPALQKMVMVRIIHMEEDGKQ